MLDELDGSLTETEAQFEAGDSAKHFESDVYFHETIVNFVENGLLKDILDSLTNRIGMVRRFAQSKPGPHLVESMQEHRAILLVRRHQYARLYCTFGWITGKIPSAILCG